MKGGTVYAYDFEANTHSGVVQGSLHRFGGVIEDGTVDHDLVLGINNRCPEWEILTDGPIQLALIKRVTNLGSDSW